MKSKIKDLEVEYIRGLILTDTVEPDHLKPFYKNLKEDHKFNKEIRDYINNKLMIQERYLFVKKIDNVIHAKCSYCGHESTLKSVPKNQTFSECEKCKSKLESRNTKHKKHRDSTFRHIVYFDLSKISNEIIVGYHISAYRHIEGEFETDLSVVDDIGEMAKYFFDIKSKNKVIKKKYNGYGEFSNSIFTVDSASYSFCGYSKDSLRKAISKSSAFKYMPTSLIDCCYDLVKLLDLYAKYPQIEKLSKIGLNELIEIKVCGSQTYGTINWGGKSIQKMLRLNKAEIRKYVEVVTKNRYYNHIRELFLMQQYKKHKISGEEIENAKRLFEHTNYEMFKRMISADKPSRILKYVEAQYEKDKKKNKTRIYYGVAQTFADLNDLLKDMKKLGMDINKSTIYPKNLNKHHVNLSKQVTQVISERNKVRLENRGAVLEKFCIQADGFIVVPVRSAEQLAEESNKLSHCVQSYTSKYLNGRCNLFLIRKENQQNKPFFTLETNSQMNLIQCRGRSNVDYKSSSEVELFINQFIGNAKKILEEKHERVAN